MSPLGQVRLRVVLHTVDRQRGMLQRHDLTIIAPGGGAQAGGHRSRFDEERVITNGSEGIRQTAVEKIISVADAARLPVKQLFRSHHPTPECLTDRLVPETDSEDRNSPSISLDEIERDARLVRCAGARRENDMRWSQCCHSLNADLIVAHGVRLGSKLAEILHEVVDKTVVVVDDENHRGEL